MNTAHGEVNIPLVDDIMVLVAKGTTSLEGLDHYKPRHGIVLPHHPALLVAPYVTKNTNL
ncbi:MAG: hypothetical protein HQM16_09440 [Deltaproteobacteria bacterium]|nr:hypothetical protein [Deltaproteobacteria bacterium]